MKNVFRKRIIQVLLLMALTSLLFGCGKKKTGDGVGADNKDVIEEDMSVEAYVNNDPIDLPDGMVMSEIVDIDFTEEEPAEEKPVDYSTAYDFTLDSLYVYLTSEVTEDYVDGQSGIWEMLITMEQSEVMDSIGYTITDLNGNGKQELVIGKIDRTESGVSYGKDILTVYSYLNGETVLLVEGFARNVVNIMEDGQFLNIGSGGASSTAINIMKVSDDESKIDFVDTYLSESSYEDPEVIEYYHNNTGAWSIAESEKLNIDGDKFWAIEEEYEAKIKEIELKPMSKYTRVLAGPETVEDKNSKVIIDVANDVLASGLKYESFEDEKTKDSVKVAFTTEQILKNFKLYKLEFSGFDAESNLVFNVTTIYEHGDIIPDTPLLADINFYGDIASYGISYDENGETKYFSIDMSGEDGHLMLNSFVAGTVSEKEE